MEPETAFFDDCKHLTFFSSHRNSSLRQALLRQALWDRGDYRVLGRQYRPDPASVARVVPAKSTVLGRGPIFTAMTSDSVQ